MRIATALAVCSLSLQGCATVLLPLCPAIAKNSVYPPEPGRYVNVFAEREATRRGLSVVPHSWFTVSVSGFAPSVWVYSNEYAPMICAFDPRSQTILMRETYMSCTAHANDWIAKLRGSHHEELMLTETKFYENCVSAE